jgi:hypothetical protein
MNKMQRMQWMQSQPPRAPGGVVWDVVLSLGLIVLGALLVGLAFGVF